MMYIYIFTSFLFPLIHGMGYTPGAFTTHVYALSSKAVLFMISKKNIAGKQGYCSGRTGGDQRPSIWPVFLG